MTLAAHEWKSADWAFQKGLFSANRIIGEIGDVLNDKAVGRENDTELTFFETTGSAVFDLVTAQRIYEKVNK